MARADAATGLKPAYSFDQLVIGPNNHVAVAACKEVLKAPGEQYNPLFIFGPAGVGKTHLMQAVAHEMLQKDPAMKVKYISAERFMNEIVAAIAEDRIVDLRRLYSELDLLIVDDVQYLTESKIAQEELFHMFNNMHQEGRQAILAADRPPTQLSNLSAGIKSRLEWGLSTDIKIPDEATRLEILRKKQAAQGLTIPDEMLQLVASSLRSNVRELEGFLKRMHAYVTLSHQQVTLDLVNAVIRELAPAGESAPQPTAPFIPPNESPAPPPVTPTLKPDVRPMFGSKPNGHGNLGGNVNGNVNGNGNGVGNGNGHGNGHANGKPGLERPSLSPMGKTPAGSSLPPTKNLPPAPATSDNFDKILEAIDIGAMAPPTPSPVPVEPEPAPAPRPASPLPAAAPVPPPVSASTPAPTAARPEPVEALPETPAPDVALDETAEDPLAAGHKEVGAVFFFPEGHNKALETVHQKFQEVIKKHKLKFRLKRVHNEAYAFKGKINYSNFVNVCKANKVPVAIVIGPPPDTFIPEQDFYDLLTVTLDVQGVSLQLVNWGEINKDYRYLNLALDIALVRSR